MNAISNAKNLTATRELALVPPVDVVEDADGITLTADLPGVTRESLRVEVESDTLTIEGEITLPASENLVFHHLEVDLPRYRRVFTLSRELDIGQVVAEFRLGVLTLHIPRAEQVRPRRIEIQAA